MACDNIKRDKRPNLNKCDSALWLCTGVALLKRRVNRNVNNQQQGSPGMVYYNII